MNKKRLMTFGLIALILLGGLALVLLGPVLAAGVYTRSRTYEAMDAPDGRVAIIFGAGLQRDGTPSTVLRDRVATGVDLYQAGKVEKLLMSGDNRFDNYNEPAAMRDYAVQLGVPVDDIVLDYAGRRTYDTCYRAGAIFGIDRALLVTQAFHLPRAVFTCNALGIDARGVVADRRAYRRGPLNFWRLREIPATAVAMWEVYVSRPLPVLGDPEPIFTGEFPPPVGYTPRESTTASGGEHESK